MANGASFVKLRMELLGVSSGASDVCAGTPHLAGRNWRYPLTEPLASTFIPIASILSLTKDAGRASQFALKQLHAAAPVLRQAQDGVVGG